MSVIRQRDRLEVLQSEQERWMSVNCGIFSCCQRRGEAASEEDMKEAPRLSLNLLNSELVLTRFVQAIPHNLPPSLPLFLLTPPPSSSSLYIHSLSCSCTNPHTPTHPSSTSIPKQPPPSPPPRIPPPALSKLSKPALGANESSALIFFFFSFPECNGGAGGPMGYSGYQPLDRAVLAGHSEITGCHLEPMLDRVSALQRSITTTLIKCPPPPPTFFFSRVFIHFQLSDIWSLLGCRHLVFVCRDYFPFTCTDQLVPKRSP